jgi:hypothetical protein
MENLAKKNAPFFPLMGGYQCDALQANGSVRSVKFTNARIFVTTDTTTHADVDIKLKSSVFLQLMQGEDLTELLRQDKISVAIKMKDHILDI